MKHDSELAELIMLGATTKIHPLKTMEGEAGETVHAIAPGTSSEIPAPLQSGILSDGYNRSREGGETPTGGTSREIPPPSTHGHSEDCPCRRCKGMWEALLAAHPDGTPFFTDDELETMSNLPAEAWG